MADTKAGTTYSRAPGAGLAAFFAFGIRLSLVAPLMFAGRRREDYSRRYRSVLMRCGSERRAWASQTPILCQTPAPCDGDLSRSCIIRIIQSRNCETRHQGFAPKIVATYYTGYSKYLGREIIFTPRPVFIMYGRVHRSVKKICRAAPRAPRMLCTPPPPGHRLLELGNTVPQVRYTLYT